MKLYIIFYIFVYKNSARKVTTVTSYERDVARPSFRAKTILKIVRRSSNC